MPNELWFSIVPSLTAIVLATWTKQVIPSLLIGLWLGSFILQRSLLISVSATVDYIVGVLSDPGNLDVLLFLYVFSGLVALIQLSGGVQAFARYP
jgi:tetracycline resistance efflux pump